MSLHSVGCHYPEWRGFTIPGHSQGGMDQSCPSKELPYYNDAQKLGIKFVFSGKDTYWLNHETMHQYVNNIPVPYIEEHKEKLGLPTNLRTLWSIDMWAVQRSE